MLPVTIVATGRGIPRWRSTKRRKTRPSFSRKNVLKKKNDTKKAAEVSPSMPPATPFRRVAPISGTAAVTSLAALSAPWVPTPRSATQLAMRSVPLWSAAVISSPFCTMPPITIRATTAPTTSSPSSTMPAAAARGMWRWSAVTSGTVTAATTAAATTGPTMDEIWPRNQTRPTRTTPIPTRNQASIPSSRSHAGVANMCAS